MTPQEALHLLELPATATPSEIKRRWRELCMTHHPDHGGDPAALATVTEAYRTAFAVATALFEMCGKCGGQGEVHITQGLYTITMPCPICSIGEFGL